MADKGKMRNVNVKGGGMGGLWFAGFLGAAIYYIQQSPDFWAGVWGVIKALFWPGFLVYQAFKLLHM
jgi:hypothetical protein